MDNNRNDRSDRNDRNDRPEVFSTKVKAGKRTYFFDVKATRSNDYYLTITESKRRFDGDGYEKMVKNYVLKFKLHHQVIFLLLAEKLI